MSSSISSSSDRANALFYEDGGRKQLSTILYTDNVQMLDVTYHDARKIPQDQYFTDAQVIHLPFLNYSELICCVYRKFSLMAQRVNFVCCGTLSMMRRTVG